MKIAVVGSRNLFPETFLFEKYLTKVSEIVSGGAKGVDDCVAKYAKLKHIKLVEFLPKYEIYGRVAPIIRNKEIVDYADKVLVFWDGKSKGTLSVINYAKIKNKECEIIIL